jgi:hypothetical protein
VLAVTTPSENVSARPVGPGSHVRQGAVRLAALHRAFVSGTGGDTRPIERTNFDLADMLRAWYRAGRTTEIRCNSVGTPRNTG